MGNWNLISQHAMVPLLVPCEGRLPLSATLDVLSNILSNSITNMYIFEDTFAFYTLLFYHLQSALEFVLTTL